MSFEGRITEVQRETNPSPSRNFHNTIDKSHGLIDWLNSFKRKAVQKQTPDNGIHDISDVAHPKWWHFGKHHERPDGRKEFALQTTTLEGNVSNFIAHDKPQKGNYQPTMRDPVTDELIPVKEMWSVRNPPGWDRKLRTDADKAGIVVRTRIFVLPSGHVVTQTEREYFDQATGGVRFETTTQEYSDAKVVALEPEKVNAYSQGSTLAITYATPPSQPEVTDSQVVAGMDFFGKHRPLDPESEFRVQIAGYTADELRSLAQKLRDRKVGLDPNRLLSDATKRTLQQWAQIAENEASARQGTMAKNVYDYLIKADGVNPNGSGELSGFFAPKEEVQRILREGKRLQREMELHPERFARPKPKVLPWIELERIHQALESNPTHLQPAPVRPGQESIAWYTQGLLPSWQRLVDAGVYQLKTIPTELKHPDLHPPLVPERMDNALRVLWDTTIPPAIMQRARDAAGDGKPLTLGKILAQLANDLPDRWQIALSGLLASGEEGRDMAEVLAKKAYGPTDETMPPVPTHPTYQTEALREDVSVALKRFLEMPLPETVGDIPQFLLESKALIPSLGAILQELTDRQRDFTTLVAQALPEQNPTLRAFGGQLLLQMQKRFATWNQTEQG